MTWPKSTPESTDEATIRPTATAARGIFTSKMVQFRRKGGHGKDGKSHRLNRSWCSSSPKENREEKVEGNNDISKKIVQISINIEALSVAKAIGWKFGVRRLFTPLNIPKKTRNGDPLSL